MSNKAGTMNPHFVWLFALAAIALGIGGGYATAGLGIKVSSAVFLGTYALAGFMATYLTRAGTGLAVLAFVVASLATAGIYYALVSGMSSSSDGAQIGSFIGAFAAAVALVETLVAGIGGCVAGKRIRGQAA